MLAEIYSGALTGIEAYAVSIEVHVGHGEPRTVVVGYRLLDRPFS